MYKHLTGKEKANTPKSCDQNGPVGLKKNNGGSCPTVHPWKDRIMISTIIRNILDWAETNPYLRVARAGKKIPEYRIWGQGVSISQ